MAYDFFAGAEDRRTGMHAYVGSAGFDELPAFARLVRRGDVDIVERMSNLFDDQTFDPGAIERGLDALLPLMSSTLHPDERHLLHKLIAILSFASRNRQHLHGISD